MTTEPRIPTLMNVVDVIESLYDPAWAREWDAVGLVCGDPRSQVRRVMLAVDPVESVIEEALAWHADLLITHHPLLLRPVHGIPTDNAKGRILHRLVRGGCALYTAHSNADAAARGVSDALARVLGLTDLEPLSADPADPVDKIVTLVPEEVADKVVEALLAAGAGDAGEYATVAWAGTGTGSFTPGPGAEGFGAAPAAEPGGGQRVALAGPQRRIEMVLPRPRRSAVVHALRAVHPAQDVAFDVYEVAGWSAPRGIGRVGRLGAPTTLREFALLVAEALPASAQGVRIAGDPTAEVFRVAVCGGSGDSLLEAVRASGADVFVTSDLRHHHASETREQAADGPPYLVDVAHWASEWPWLAGAANRLQGALDAAGTPIEVLVSARSTDPWTFRVPSPGGVVR